MKERHISHTLGASARIPGLEWILAFNNGSLAAFINGYLPVVALLGLILILPVIFGLVARNYECRRTYSDIQRSMLSRYFYYQVRPIYAFVDLLTHCKHSLTRLLNSGVRSLLDCQYLHYCDGRFSLEVAS